MIITLDQFKKLPFYKENTSLYESVFASNAFLINNKDGFIIYMYELIDKDYASHEEFNFYPLKLGRINKSVDAIKDILFDDKLSQEVENLVRITTIFLDKKNKNAHDLAIYDSEVKLITDAIFNNNLFPTIGQLKLEISDLQRNLPERPNPIITDAYIITTKSTSIYSQFELLDTPSEMKSPPIINGLILPKKITQGYCKLYTGFQLAPMMGHGAEEIWKTVNNQWECITSEIIWHS